MQYQLCDSAAGQFSGKKPLFSIYKKNQNKQQKMRTPQNDSLRKCKRMITFVAVILILQLFLIKPSFINCSSTFDDITTANRSNLNDRNNNLRISRTNNNNNNNETGSNIANKSNISDMDSKQIPIVRLPSNTLLKYTAYKDVSILHFRIPKDTRTALFSFKAYEESKSAFCKYTN